MSRTAKSARGSIVDFDLLAIKQQIAAQPTPASVDQRRKFIDIKDGIKSKSPEETQDNSILQAMQSAAENSSPRLKKEKK